MKRSRILSLSNHSHFYAILFTLIGLSFVSLYFAICLILYVIYLYRIRLLSKNLLIISIIFFMLTAFLCLYDFPLQNSFKGLVSQVSYEDEYTKITARIGLRQVLIYYQGSIDIKPGDIILVNGISKSVINNDYGLYLKSQMIFQTTNASEVKIISHQLTPSYLRYLILSYYKKRLDSISFSFVSSLVFAYDSFNENIKESINEIGISHLFCISGLHVALLTSFLKRILAKNISLYQKRNYIIIPFLIIYSFLCGNAYGVLRSVIMYILVEINFNKQYNLSRLDICSIAYIMILFVNPLSIFRLSFRLTFIVTFFIILGRYLLEDKNRIRAAYKLTIISFMAALPLVSSIKNETNLLSIIVSPIFVACFSLLIMPITYLLVIFPVLYKPIVVIYKMFLMAVNAVDKIDFFKFSMSTASPLLIILYYLFLLVLYIRIEQRKNKPIHVILLISTVLIMMLNPYFKSNDRLIMLDVGQGDSFLLVPRHKNTGIAIDSFNNNVEQIKSYGINSLDTLIITHSDNDHIESAENLIQTFNCSNLIVSEYEDSDEIEKLKDLVEEVTIVKSGDVLFIGNFKFTFLAPITRLDDSNSNSLVFYVDINGSRVLFTGDMTTEEEMTILSKYDKLSCDLFKVPHHGASTGMSNEIMRALTYDVALISVGYQNFYGHPAFESLQKLANKTYYRTDRDGSVEISFSSRNYKIYINRSLNPLMMYWRKKFIEKPLTK